MAETRNRYSDRIVAASSSRRLPLTREGTIWLIASSALLITGLFKGINLINLLTCSMIALAVLNIVLAGRQVRQLSAKRAVYDPIFAGTPFHLRVELHNPSARRRTGIVISDAAVEEPARWFIAELKAFETLTLERELVYERRGLHLRGPIVATSGYPFGLAARQLTLAGKEPYLVLPRVVKLQPGVMRRLLSAAELEIGNAFARPIRHLAAESEVHGLRPYRPGDSPRWIHWRTSARRGDLMVREYEDIPSERLTLLIDPWLPGEVNASVAQELLEGTITLAASIIWEWCRQTGNPFTVIIAGRNPEVITGASSRPLAIKLLERLAAEDGYTYADHEPLLARLSSQRLSRGRVLAVCVRAGGAIERLAAELRSPIRCICLADERLDAYLDLGGQDCRF